MTSEQIKEASHIDLSERQWLKEIALLLAELIDVCKASNKQPVQQFMQRRK